jgi:hypothetical protein
LRESGGAWLANFVGVDGPASSALTREMLGWEPTNIGLIADLDQGYTTHRRGDARRVDKGAFISAVCSSGAASCLEVTRRRAPVAQRFADAFDHAAGVLLGVEN